MDTPAATRLHTVLNRIRLAEARFHRPAGSVKLLAVSKTCPTSAIRAMVEAGQQCFGENYVQEVSQKIASPELATLNLEWHFIGPLQANKTRSIAKNVTWVHSVDRLKIAERLNAQRPEAQPPLNICLQVNIDQEDTKSGFNEHEIPEIAQAITTLPRLRLRGLMGIPAPATDFEAQRRPFARLRILLEQLNATGLALDTLSMGMSNDLEAAIAEGTTLVRIGTALFGTRASTTRLQYP
ncbi:MAG: YggS family pyridoxal phosphate-dependent enzyme [Candidatus Contendobacter odensis]|uniref:Pyridoxal phosphate homeostasis protein n=1 Tax=Candidatus Contendibacter odensensis TaxID=1400860 RepID=A0A2G6PEW1_9GAMM|nr:MAG: YggS family pyridoxal phosphate-dependent enzyme [Candidatus Contendobacter odensis]